MATGLRYERLADGRIRRWFERATGETVHVRAPVYFYDDFIGYNAPMLSETGSVGIWQDTIIGAAPPLAGQVTDELNGVVQVALTADSQEQQALLDFGDVLCFDANKALQAEFRFKVKVLPTAAVTLAMGLGSANNKVLASISKFAAFSLTSDGVIKCETDDNTTDTAPVTSGTTATADDQYRIARIDMSDLTSVKFYLDGVRVASGTTFDMSALAATDGLQPFIQAYKASGTVVGTLEVDSCRVWSYR